jgi:PAS domain S-box-containing protein
MTTTFDLSGDVKDRGQAAEVELRQRERELSQLVDMVPSHLWRLSSDGEPVFFNRRMVEFLGRDVAALERPGCKRLEVLTESVHPDDATKFQQALASSIATGSPFSMRYRLRRHDGVYHWMSSRAEPLRDEDGRIVQWHGLCHDIDDAMYAEEALRASERQLQNMIDALPIRVWRAPSFGGPIYLNKRYRDQLRDLVPEFDALGSASMDLLHRELIHPEDSARVAQTLRTSFENGSAVALRFRCREKDGSYRWAQCRVEPRRDEKGDVAEWYGVSLDIDDEVRSQEALRERERELQLLIDMVPVHIGRTAPNGEPTFFSKRTAASIGLDHLEAWDKPGISRLATMIAGAVHPEDAPRMQEGLMHALGRGEPYSIRYRQRDRHGVYRWMEGRADPLRDESGAIVQWYHVAIDIEDQVQTQDALRRASDELAHAVRAASLAELSAAIAHEVNQPLAAIVTNSQACQRWLSVEPPNLDRAKVTAAHITRDANAAADVVSRIRSLFRQKPEARLAEDINRLIAEVCGLMTEEMAAKNVRVESHLATDLPLVPVDRVQVQQVLVNLIRNGIEAMEVSVDRARVLRIGTRRHDNDSIRIEIRDSGDGFQDVQSVLEPFFTTKENGMGIGLAICRSIVEAHGGRLSIGNHEAGGAVVVFTLTSRAE